MPASSNASEVPPAAWREAREALLRREKAVTRELDALSAARRALPRVRVSTPYVFQEAQARPSLAALFGSCSQLIVYHFMFGPQSDSGCPSCSFWIDVLDGAAAHLSQRDIALVLVSRAPYGELAAYRERMGWRVRWVSCGGNGFNADFGVAFTAAEAGGDGGEYNYGSSRFRGRDAPGLSVFQRDPDGGVFHTYSCYGRGLDILNGAYQLMDLTPKGRDEDGLPTTMSWLRRHDEYPAG